MSAVDSRLVAAMRAQLATRPVGATRVGWKYGSGDGERIGGEIAEEVVAANDYHRAVAFGPFVETRPPGLEGALFVNGERHAAAPSPDAVANRVAAVARVLASVAEDLRPGDRIITGLIVNVPVAPGDEVAADIGALGRVVLRIA